MLQISLAPTDLVPLMRAERWEAHTVFSGRLVCTVDAFTITSSVLGLCVWWGIVRGYTFTVDLCVLCGLYCILECMYEHIQCIQYTHQTLPLQTAPSPKRLWTREHPHDCCTVSHGDGEGHSPLLWQPALGPNDAGVWRYITSTVHDEANICNTTHPLKYIILPIRNEIQILTY